MIPWIQTGLVNLVSAFKKRLSANYLPNANLHVGDLRMSNKEAFLSMTSQCGGLWKGQRFGWRASKENVA